MNTFSIIPGNVYVLFGIFVAIIVIFKVAETWLAGSTSLDKAVGDTKKSKDKLLPFIRRPSIMYPSERDFYKVLKTIFGDRYQIFSQVSIGAIVDVSSSVRGWERNRYWNRVDRKSFDFVLCDNVNLAPVLIIELDGKSHDAPKRQKRDRFVDEVMKIAKIPIVHVGVRAEYDIADLSRYLDAHMKSGAQN